MLNFKKLRVLIFTALILVFCTSYSFAASYTVTSGDTLFKISQLFNTTVDQLYSDNHLRSSMIYPGQALTVPAENYTVSSGDTLYLISKKYGISLYNLRKANNIWYNTLYVGQKLIIPTSNSTFKAAGNYTQSERDLLARLITAEATGQPYDAQVAVGAVVLNRVESSSFPNTIHTVIYQVVDGYYQFTPVKNGWINKPATETAKKAAYDALKGVDPTKGAIFYFDDSATNTWLWSKPIAARIGRMVYTY